MLVYLNFLSVFFVYALISILSVKNKYDINHIISILLCLLVIGLSAGFNNSMNINNIERFLMALCYPFMGYLAMIKK